MIGVKSTARLFGPRAKPIIGGFYAGAYVLWVAAATMAGAGIVFALLSLVVAGLLAWQVWTLDGTEPGNPLLRFRSNHYAGLGLAMSLAFLAEWVW